MAVFLCHDFSVVKISEKSDIGGIAVVETQAASFIVNATRGGEGEVGPLSENSENML